MANAHAVCVRAPSYVRVSPSVGGTIVEVRSDGEDRPSRGRRRGLNRRHERAHVCVSGGQGRKVALSAACFLHCDNIICKQ